MSNIDDILAAASLVNAAREGLKEVQIELERAEKYLLDCEHYLLEITQQTSTALSVVADKGTSSTEVKGGQGPSGPTGSRLARRPTRQIDSVTHFFYKGTDYVTNAVDMGVGVVQRVKRRAVGIWLKEEEIPRVREACYAKRHRNGWGAFAKRNKRGGGQ
jgi:hypothetical protein